MNLTEANAKLQTLRTQAVEALEEIRSNTDDSRTAELEARHDAIMAEFDKTEKVIERELRHENTMKRLEERAQQQREERRPGGSGEQRGSVEPEGKVTYRSAFYAYLSAEGQLGALTAEQRAVLQQGFTQVPDEQRAQTAGTTTAGGFTVPTELQGEIIRVMKAFGPMYDPGVTREMVTSSGNPMPFPTVDDTANTAAATTEGVTLTDNGSGDVVFGQRQLDAWAFATPWIRVSKELADDSITGMETLLGELLGERLGRLANTQLTTGTGSSAPNGIATAAALGKTAASATAIAYDEIFDLEHSVDPAYRQSPRFGFMMNDTTLLAVRKLKDGQGNYLWQAGNVAGGIPNTINNRQYWINQALASPASAARYMLAGDFGKYIVRKVGAPLVGAIQDKDFWPGFGIAGWIRFDGELMDTTAVKYLRGL